MMRSTEAAGRIAAVLLIHTSILLSTMLMLRWPKCWRRVVRVFMWWRRPPESVMTGFVTMLCQIWPLKTLTDRFVLYLAGLYFGVCLISLGILQSRSARESTFYRHLLTWVIEMDWVLASIQ